MCGYEDAAGKVVEGKAMSLLLQGTQGSDEPSKAGQSGGFDDEMPLEDLLGYAEGHRWPVNVDKVWIAVAGIPPFLCRQRCGASMMLREHFCRRWLYSLSTFRTGLFRRRTVNFEKDCLANYCCRGMTAPGSKAV